MRPVHEAMIKAAKGKNIWLVGGGELVGPVRGRRAARRDHPGRGPGDARRRRPAAAPPPARVPLDLDRRGAGRPVRLSHLCGRPSGLIRPCSPGRAWHREDVAKPSTTRRPASTATSPTRSNSLDWLFEVDEGTDNPFGAFFSGVGAFAMGATTYEWVLKNDNVLDRAGELARHVRRRAVLGLHPPRAAAGAGRQRLHGQRRRRNGCTRRWWWPPRARTSGWSAAATWSASSPTLGLLDEIILGIAPVTAGRRRAAAAAPPDGSAVGADPGGTDRPVRLPDAMRSARSPQLAATGRGRRAAIPTAEPPFSHRRSARAANQRPGRRNRPGRRSNRPAPSRAGQAGPRPRRDGQNRSRRPAMSTCRATSGGAAIDHRSGRCGPAAPPAPRRGCLSTRSGGSVPGSTACTVPTPADPRTGTAAPGGVAQRIDRRVQVGDRHRDPQRHVVGPERVAPPPARRRSAIVAPAPQRLGQLLGAARSRLAAVALEQHRQRARRLLGGPAAGRRRQVDLDRARLQPCASASSTRLCTCSGVDTGIGDPAPRRRQRLQPQARPRAITPVIVGDAGLAVGSPSDSPIAAVGVHVA